MKMYKIVKDGRKTLSPHIGKYAGWDGGSKARRIFGTLDCKSGMRMKKENRVFFHSIEDAIKSGYKPCKKCNPISQEKFEKIKDSLVEKP
jgi:Zn-finger domain-containing protein